MEQPTLFYAIALTLAFMNFGGGINYWLAWGYVALRIVHSILQATINVVTWRFLVFTLASFCLLGLTTHAGLPSSTCGLSAEARRKLDMGRPAELADRPDPVERIAAVGQHLGIRAKVAGLQLTYAMRGTDDRQRLRLLFRRRRAADRG